MWQLARLCIIMAGLAISKVSKVLHDVSKLTSDSLTCYRPKRSFGQGNIFTPVCHSVHRVGGESTWPGTPPDQAGTPPGADTPPGPGRYTPPRGPGRYTPPGPGRYTPPPGPGRYTPLRTRQVHPPRRRHPPGTRQVPPPPRADTPPGTRQVHTPPPPPPRDTVNARPVRILLECILVWVCNTNICRFLLISGRHISSMKGWMCRAQYVEQRFYGIFIFSRLGTFSQSIHRTGSELVVLLVDGTIHGGKKIKTKNSWKLGNEDFQLLLRENIKCQVLCLYRKSCLWLFLSQYEAELRSKSMFIKFQMHTIYCFIFDAPEPKAFSFGNLPEFGHAWLMIQSEIIFTT